MKQHQKVPFDIEYPIITFPYTLIKSILLGILDLTLTTIIMPFGILGGNLLSIVDLLISVVNIPLWFICPIMQTISASKNSEYIKANPSLADGIRKSPHLTAQMMKSIIYLSFGKHIWKNEESALEFAEYVTGCNALQVVLGLRAQLSTDILTNEKLATLLNMDYNFRNGKHKLTTKSDTLEENKIAAAYLVSIVGDMELRDPYTKLQPANMLA